METKLFHRIVVPADFSSCSEEAWALAQRVAESLGSEMVLVHVFAALHPARARGLKARTVLRNGVPHQEIVQLASDERADIVIMGTHGRSGLSRVLLGSVAERVIHFAPCPVLTVRKPD